MPAPFSGSSLTPEQVQQIRTECQQLVDSGVSSADVKRQLAQRWQKSESRIRNICEGIVAAAKPVGLISIADLDENDERIAELVKAERELVAAKQETRGYMARTKALERDIAELSELLGIKDALSHNIKPLVIKREKKGTDSQAVAFAVASDWHMGAVIKPETVNFLNEVNPEITEARIERFFQALVKLIKKEQAHVKIDTLCLALIGDFIENYLHPELIEESIISPTEQTRAVKRCLIGGLDYLLRETELKIVCPTAVGNHGRTTDKMRAATSTRNSFEQMIYLDLADHYANEPRVTMHITDSYFNYITLFDHVIRVHHGDACRFGGGIGGLMIPLRKFIHRANQQIVADMSICGHFHSLIQDFDIMVNGSLVGPSAYSTKLGFPPERPQQIFRLLDVQRSWTVSAPILVAEQEKKSGRIVG